MTKQEERAAKIERIMRLTWDSLQSHLPYCHGSIEGWAAKRGETHEFHKTCVREYAETIKTLSELY